MGKVTHEIHKLWSNMNNIDSTVSKSEACLQTECSLALVKICVADMGNFGERSRVPAMFNTPPDSF